jgi:hypothetical protein
VVMAISALPSRVWTIARATRAITRFVLRAATRCFRGPRLRAVTVSPSPTGTSWDVLRSARQCVQCDAPDGPAVRSEGRHDVGARQRPNLGANQRGRASVSSSASHGGAPRRRAAAGPIEALLDGDARARYSAIGNRSGDGRLPPTIASPCTSDRWLAPGTAAQEHSSALRSELHEQSRAPSCESGPGPGQTHNIAAEAAAPVLASRRVRQARGSNPAAARWGSGSVDASASRISGFRPSQEPAVDRRAFPLRPDR